MRKFDIKGVVVCESPNIEEDAKILADYYKSLYNSNKYWVTQYSNKVKMMGI